MPTLKSSEKRSEKNNEKNMEKKPSEEFLKEAIYLVDASSYIFRAYYAVQTELTAPDGTPTHATHAFIQMVRSLIQQHNVQKLVLVWDQKGPGFRHEIFPEYKANRAIPPEDLSLQIENSRKLSETLGIRQMGEVGFEADDVIASVVAQNPQKNFVIVSSDKDLLQLVNDKVWCLDTLRKKWSNEQATIEKFGVTPEKVPLVQALCGDSVDNIPGAPSIGPKTASALINDFGKLETIFETAKERQGVKVKSPYKDALKGKKIDAIAENIDEVKMSLKLVTLVKDIPLKWEKDHFDIQKPDPEKLLPLAKQLGFKKIASEVGGDPGEAEMTSTSDISFDFKLIENLAEFKNVLQEHRDCEEFALDTETFSLDRQSPDNLVGMSLAFDEKTGYYVGFRHMDQDELDPSEIFAELKNFLVEKPRSLIFQNAKFDLHILSKAGFDFDFSKTQIEDTMIASFVLDPSKRHGMDALAQRCLDGYETIKFEDVVPKGGNFSQVPLEDAKDYAAEDAVVTMSLWMALKKELEEKKAWKIYEELDRPLIPILFEMEREGVLVDRQYLKELSDDFHKDLENIQSKSREMLKDYGVDVAPDVNFLSPKQMGVLLFEKLDLPVIKKGKTGPSTDQSVLEELALQHPFPALILEIRELSKLLSTYVDALPKLLQEETSRVHTEFSQTIAQTGRLASSNPNLQNIPIRTDNGRKIRQAFIARDGYVLLGVDYSQIELRVLAEMSGEENLSSAFIEGQDIHRKTASLMFNIEEKDVTDEQRRSAKAINFGIIYGQSAFGLSKTLKISRKEAQSFIDAYFKSYPGIREFMDQNIQAARDAKCATTITGRQRPLKEIESKNPHLKSFAERMAINSPLQGTAADLMKLAMIRVYGRIKEELPEAKLLLQVHDELIFECPKASAEDLKKMVLEELESPDIFKSFSSKKWNVPLKANAAVGSNWKEI